MIKSLGTWNDNNVLASKSGTDDLETPIIKDGFKTGNIISFKLYDASEDEEIPLVNATFFNLVDGSEISPSPTFDMEVTRDPCQFARLGKWWQPRGRTPRWPNSARAFASARF